MRGGGEQDGGGGSDNTAGVFYRSRSRANGVVGTVAATVTVVGAVSAQGLLTSRVYSVGAGKETRITFRPEHVEDQRI